MEGTRQDTNMTAPWKMSIVRYSEEAPDELLGSPHNWRRHNGAQQNTMVALFEELGWLAPVIVNETTGALINGHMRTELAMRHGVPRIPVAWVSLSEADEKKAILTFDTIGTFAYADDEALMALMADADVKSMTNTTLLTFLTSMVGDAPAEASTTAQEPRSAPEVCCPECGAVFTPERHRGGKNG